MPRRLHVVRSQKQKLAAVMAAEMVGVRKAAEQTGIPKQTISDWINDPKYGHFRTKTREDLAEEVKVVAHLAWKRVAETLPMMEPRDAMFAAEKASTILQLVTGEATQRTEHRELTESLDDHERELLSAAIDEWLATTDAVPG